MDATGAIELYCVDANMVQREPVWGLNDVPLFPSALPTSDDDARIKDIENRVADAFKGFDEVSAIYMQRYRQQLQFTLFLDIKGYNDDLMDRLLDVEYDLLQDEYADLLIDFSYLPGAGGEGVVHPSASMVLRK